MISVIGRLVREDAGMESMELAEWSIVGLSLMIAGAQLWSAFKTISH